MPDVDHTIFEAYLETLGIPKGASVIYRRDMIAAMYRVAKVYGSGYGMPIFPVAKLRGGWIGWLASEPDMQASEGWPYAYLATRHFHRPYMETVGSGDGKRKRRFMTDAVEVRSPAGFDVIAATLRFCHRYRGEERAKIIGVFCAAIGRIVADYGRSFSKELELAEQLFKRAILSKDGQTQAAWRKLAKELDL